MAVGVPSSADFASKLVRHLACVSAPMTAIPGKSARAPGVSDVSGSSPRNSRWKVSGFSAQIQAQASARSRVWLWMNWVSLSTFRKFSYSDRWPERRPICEIAASARRVPAFV